VQRNSLGETRFFQGESLIIHENRRWMTKPSIKEAVWRISKCIPDIDKRVLSRILEFSFYVLSPTSGLGAIMVWLLKDQTPKDQNLQDFGLSIMEESHMSMIKHLFGQTDGATYLTSDGRLLNAGIHLKVSDVSRKIIQAFKGTRHTNSIRFSYDLDDAIVVTVSEDGPVTIFFQGVNIADLQMHSVYQQTRDLRVEQNTNLVKVNTFEITCSHCHKPSLVDEITIDGQNRVHSIYCTTCKAELYTSECFSVESRPFKRLAQAS